MVQGVVPSLIQEFKAAYFREVCGRLLPRYLFLVLVLLQESCGSQEEFNLFRYVSRPTIGDTKAAKMEEARVRLDLQDYSGAVSILSPLMESPKEDSNEVRLLYAAAKLGQVNLGIWSLISSFLDTQETSSQKKPSTASSPSPSSGGIDDFLDSLTSTVFGSAEEASAKSMVLTESVLLLKTAPFPEERALRNTACIIGAILAIPSFTSAKDAVSSAAEALSTIQSTATSGGSSCPDISMLDQALEAAQAAVTHFNAVLVAAGNCPFLNVSETFGKMNSIESQMAKLIAGADKGCSGIPSCPATFPNCASLFPACVQQTLNQAGGTAGDGVITACELTRNCLVSGECF